MTAMLPWWTTAFGMATFQACVSVDDPSIRTDFATECLLGVEREEKAPRNPPVDGGD